MVTQYISTSGKVTVIAEMPDPYLVNSLLHYKKRLKLLTQGGVYQASIQEIVDSLAAEVSKRGLTLDN